MKLIALDVDGVLAERGIIIGADSEMKRFDIQDGQGIVVAQKAQLVFAIISGRDSAATTRRAKELGIAEVFQGVRAKTGVLKQIAARHNLHHEAVLYMGDDIQDLGPMAWAGVSAAPANANGEVLGRVDIVTRAEGGRGAVREVVELVLKAQNLWSAVVEAYLRDA
ncbi:MAG: HAD hydrolase family protein [Candidatus Sumerlaeia bacterium]|nr:HAD hydrolase family protein [Candidatus Sumerlaeia bacterium]